MMFFSFSILAKHRRRGNTLDLFLVHLASSTDLLKRRRDSRAKRPGGAFPPQTKHAGRIPVCLNHPRAIYRLSPAGGRWRDRARSTPMSCLSGLCVPVRVSASHRREEGGERGGGEGRRRRLALMWPSFERGSETGGREEGEKCALPAKKKKEEKKKTPASAAEVQFQQRSWWHSEKFARLHRSV